MWIESEREEEYGSMALCGVVGLYYIYIYIFYTFFFCERAVATLNVLLTYFQSEHTQYFLCIFVECCCYCEFFLTWGMAFVNGYLSITVL